MNDVSDILDDIKNNINEYDIEDFPLKRCPFCGEKGKLIHGNHCGDYYYVECQGCGAISEKYDVASRDAPIPGRYEVTDPRDLTMIFAICAWNRREKNEISKNITQQNTNQDG